MVPATNFCWVGTCTIVHHVQIHQIKWWKSSKPIFFLWTTLSILSTNISVFRWWRRAQIFWGWISTKNEPGEIKSTKMRDLRLVSSRVHDSPYTLAYASTDHLTKNNTIRMFLRLPASYTSTTKKIKNCDKTY